MSSSPKCTLWLVYYVHYGYNEVVTVTITKFRQNLFQLADRALEGQTVEFTHKGVTFKVVPTTPVAKLSRLTRRRVIADGVDPDTISDTSELLKETESLWEKKWADL